MFDKRPRRLSNLISRANGFIIVIIADVLFIIECHYLMKHCLSVMQPSIRLGLQLHMGCHRLGILSDEQAKLWLVAFLLS